MSADPLTAFVGRSVGGEVHDVRAERIGGDPDGSLERIFYREASGAERSLVLKRLPRGRPLEAQLLPFLARKTDRVPQLRARGLPRAAIAARPWVLMEDLVAAPTACPDARAILAALLEVRRAVARDAPALRALGVAGPGTVLVHGDLRCANARSTARGVVLDGWAEAHLGDPLEDLARLRAELGPGVDDAYRDLLGIGLAGRAGRTVAAQAEESPDTTGQGSG